MIAPQLLTTMANDGTKKANNLAEWSNPSSVSNIASLFSMESYSLEKKQLKHRLVGARPQEDLCATSAASEALTVTVSPCLSLRAFMKLNAIYFIRYYSK